MKPINLPRRPRHLAVAVLTGPIGRVSGFMLELAIAGGSQLRARLFDGR
jgi:hypothetical protein